MLASVINKLWCYRSLTEKINDHFDFSGRPVLNDNDKEYVYCSQLVTIVLKKIGILSESVITSIDLCPTELLIYCEKPFDLHMYDLSSMTHNIEMLI